MILERSILKMDGIEEKCNVIWYSFIIIIKFQISMSKQEFILVKTNQRIVRSINKKKKISIQN